MKLKTQNSKFKDKGTLCSAVGGQKSKVKNQPELLSTSSGFTLIETLVAVAILMIAVAGPLTVAEKGLSASIYARNQTVGTYLAQDAMEYVKNVVDTNELNKYSTGADWLSYSAGGASVSNLSSCTQSTPCTIDTIQGGILQCTSGVNSCSPLSLGLNGYDQSSTFTQGSNQGTTYTRSFYVAKLSSVNNDSSAGANVVVSVTWPGAQVGGSGGVTLTDTMFNILQ